MRKPLGLIGMALLTAVMATAVRADPLDPYQSQSESDNVLKPGYWEMHIKGTTDTPHFNVPINRINRLCLEVGEPQKKLFMPKTMGECKTHESTDSGGLMHWKWTCTIVNGATQGSGTVTPASDHFDSAWKVVSTLNINNGYTTTTTMTVTGKRISDQCPTKRR